jgi:hypothetical protein
MIGYASNTGTKRNLEALRKAGWRIMLTPDNPTPREALPYAIDNGAWKAFQQNQPFDAEAFSSLVEKHGGAADFVVIPDIVAGGNKSLRFSLEWLPKLRHLRKVLLPVQDGMDMGAVAEVIRQWPGCGIFLGGSTEWKLQNIYTCGIMAVALKCYYHVGRVNTVRRIRRCWQAGADSFDGTSATKYCCTLPKLESARQQPSIPGLFVPIKYLRFSG